MSTDYQPQVKVTLSTVKDLSQRLSSPPSKGLTLTIAQEAMEDAEVLAALLYLLYGAEDPLRWRVAWVIEKVCERMPSLIACERNKLITLTMQPDTPHGLRRLLLSIIHNLPDADDTDVAFLNFLLDTMLDLKSPPGVQSLAMKLASRMSRIDGDLHEEFCCLVRNMELEYYSAGVKAAARQCLRERKRRTACKERL